MMPHNFTQDNFDSLLGWLKQGRGSVKDNLVKAKGKNFKQNNLRKLSSDEMIEIVGGGKRLPIGGGGFM